MGGTIAKLEVFDSLDMKVGDEVVWRHPWHRTLTKIVKITPTGIVEIEGHGGTFRRDGRARGTGTYNRGEIAVPTVADREAIERKELATSVSSMLRRLSLDYLPVSVLRSLHATLAPHAKKEGN